MGPLSAPSPARRAAPAGGGGAGAAVRARGVSFRYPSGRPGLAPLDLDAGPGEVIVVLGPNGSGKSTLLRLLATDLRPTSGTLRLLGGPADPPTPALRRRLAYAADEPVHLLPLTGRENARFFLELARGPGAGSPDALLEAFGLAPAADVRVGEYSFGMRRKLLLVEALAAEPRLLLLDEPTVGLDPEGVRTLGERVRALARAGATVVAATNEVRETPGWATRILFLHEGEVLEDADPDDLRARIPGAARIRVGLREPLESLPPLPGVTVVETAPDGLVAESPDAGRSLAPVLEALVGAGARIRDVRIREPDLGDLFRELTGRDLGPEGTDAGEAEP